MVKTEGDSSLTFTDKKPNSSKVAEFQWKFTFEAGLFEQSI